MDGLADVKPPPTGRDLKADPLPVMEAQGSAGTSRGINLGPGSDDDGWIVPPPVTLGDGSRVQLYKDGEALHAAYEAIRGATRLICLEIYIFADDATGMAFAELLAEKARAGVNVFVIYDSFGSIATKSDMFDMMRRAGVRVQEFHPFLPWKGKFQWRPLSRDHRKLLLVDDEYAWMGGLNVAGEYAGSWVVKTSTGPAEDFWRDTAMGITGPAAKQYRHAFVRTWNYCKRRAPVKRLEHVFNLEGVCGERCAWPFPQRHERRRRSKGGMFDTPEGAGQLGILASVPQRQSPLRPFLNRLIRDAKRSVLLTMAYFAPHDDLIEELCRAARRGVRVRLMLPGRGDVKLLMIAARSFYETLMTAGVQVYERQGVVLHAKTMVVDGLISLVGSTNLDYRSIEYNLELSTIVRSRAFAGQVEALFEHDVRFAKRIKAERWRHRPVRDRWVQWLVSRARNWL